MNDVWFSEAVVVYFPGRGARKVASSFEAIECLINEWPQWARGRTWRRAQTACRDALDGWRSAKAARQSFVKAAARAGLTKGRPQRMVREERGMFAATWQATLNEARELRRQPSTRMA